MNFTLKVIYKEIKRIMNKIRIYHISDTHCYHSELVVPQGIDVVIFSGDCSNPQELYQSEKEVRNFITWYASLPIKHKIFVAGNHDLAIERGWLTKDNFQQAGIIYLENDSIELKFRKIYIDMHGLDIIGETSLKVWGSPYTPTFGVGWAFNKSRAKIGEIWATIPKDTDIVVVHGPPKGVLDLSYNRENTLEFCGCESLRKRMREIKPKLVCFGHIHNCEGITNFGIRKMDHDTIYSNGTMVTDGNFGKYFNNGNVIEIEC
jgi:predicted phosphodiesterase